ncbi:hypothetical protein HYI05_16965 [Clostridium botulinum]|uniref:Uncharacterized protein n=1 Tax=Clostridium botulinum TaxID=1491 RepID=A0A0A0USW6_CLOBO|nr:hypothetical protein [Clostridium botulinum]AIW54711.1 hypothetical protein [Clostridium botulinum]AIW54773.1 hypothetical protein [Clostridium botulinum]AIW54840.1 hypothetical protein [Clostridium botulinum]MBY7009288.1 hypothetical protein [Clostridium botulinum]
MNIPTIYETKQCVEVILIWFFWGFIYGSIAVTIFFTLLKVFGIKLKKLYN